MWRNTIKKKSLRTKWSLGAQRQIDDYETIHVTGIGGDQAGNESAQRL
ncbi:hypothetical protein [Paenibacillus ihbetae]|nr:hypothetical protein [Paenibacillus ihbetae]